MKQRLQQMSVGFNSETENRLKAQEVQATRAYTAEASEAGDYDRESCKSAASVSLRSPLLKKKFKRSEKLKLSIRQQQAPQQQQQQQLKFNSRNSNSLYVKLQPQQRDPKLDGWLRKELVGSVVTV